MVPQLAVCRVPEDWDAVFAAGALNDWGCGVGRASCEGNSGEYGAVEFVEVLAVIMYEFRFILVNSTRL
jgi:hypothetical protein